MGLLATFSPWLPISWLHNFQQFLKECRVWAERSKSVSVKKLVRTFYRHYKENNIYLPKFCVFCVLETVIIWLYNSHWFDYWKRLVLIKCISTVFFIIIIPPMITFLFTIFKNLLTVDVLSKRVACKSFWTISVIIWPSDTTKGTIIITLTLWGWVQKFIVHNSFQATYGCVTWVKRDCRGLKQYFHCT